MIEFENRPLLRVVLRTVGWYVITAGGWWLLHETVPADWGLLGGEELGAFLDGAGKSVMAERGQSSGPALVPTMVAMLAAFMTALPVTWIYTYTRSKKGYQQSVVQTFLILPVIVGGIVVLVKHSLALAFSLSGIVAAVRFRTTLDDSKDAANIFVVTGIGLAAAVEPPVAFAISIMYNVLILGLWLSDFGRGAGDGREGGGGSDAEGAAEREPHGDVRGAARRRGARGAVARAARGACRSRLAAAQAQCARGGRGRAPRLHAHAAAAHD